MRGLAVCLTIGSLVFAGAGAAIPAAQPAATSRQDDGAGFVWRVFCNSGLPYAYIPANGFPASARFHEVERPQTGDIAWWPDYVAIFNAQTDAYITSIGTFKVADLRARVAPKYYRLQLAPGETPGPKPGPGECEQRLY